MINSIFLNEICLEISYILPGRRSRRNVVNPINTSVVMSKSKILLYYIWTYFRYKMRGQPLLHDNWFKHSSHFSGRPNFAQKVLTSLLKIADVSKIMTSEGKYWYFLEIHILFYNCTKLHPFSVIFTDFRQGGATFTPPQPFNAHQIAQPE